MFATPQHFVLLQKCQLHRREQPISHQMPLIHHTVFTTLHISLSILMQLHIL